MKKLLSLVAVLYCTVVATSEIDINDVLQTGTT